MAFVMLVASAFAWGQTPNSQRPKQLDAKDLSIEVDSDALQRQYLALQGMQLTAVEYSPLGSVKKLTGDTNLVLPSRAKDLDAGDTANDVLELLSDILLAKGTETLKVTSNDEPGTNPNPSLRTLRLSQEIDGKPVVNGFIGINYDKDTRKVSRLAAVFVPNRGLDAEAKISALDAEKVVPEAVASNKDTAESRVEILEGTYLAYYHEPKSPTPPRLVWIVHAQVDDDKWAYYVNGITGEIINRAPMSHSLTRKVYNANGATWNIPGQVPSSSMTTAQINADPLALEAYNHVLNADTKLRNRFPVATYAFPSQTRQIVRYGYSTGNARWEKHGSNDYIMYSKPITGTWTSATTPPDITFHEFTHGIAYRLFTVTPDLYDFEYGAIVEGTSDIAASVVQIALAGSPSSTSWRIGENFNVPSPNSPIRSMADPAVGLSGPGLDWYPLRLMNIPNVDYRHYNSTVLSHAYYLSVMGGLNAGWLKTHIPEIPVTPLHSNSTTSESRARQIFGLALNDVVVAAEPTMPNLKAAAIDAANMLYPLTPTVATSVQTAFEAVGVGYQCSGPPQVPNWSIFDLQCNGRFSVNWPSVPNTNRYLVIVAPQTLGWSFAQTATDGLNTHCMMQINTLSMARMAACNNCGCSDWTDTEYLPFSAGQCP